MSQKQDDDVIIISNNYNNMVRDNDNDVNSLIHDQCQNDVRFIPNPLINNYG